MMSHVKQDTAKTTGKNFRKIERYPKIYYPLEESDKLREEKKLNLRSLAVLYLSVTPFPEKGENDSFSSPASFTTGLTFRIKVNVPICQS